MLSENAILAVASTSIISLTAMATMVTYLMLRESTSSSKAFEQMKNTSEASIELEIVTLDLTVATCAYPGWIKDGLCDLLNNFESCQFDGGDCNPACARPDVVGDGKCDEENDTVECNEDGQDCMTSKAKQQELVSSFHYFSIQSAVQFLGKLEMVFVIAGIMFHLANSTMEIVNFQTDKKCKVAKRVFVRG